MGGATLAALPSAVQDLARFFLSLSGSASLGATGGVAGAAAPASGAGVPLCPSAPGGGAVAFGAATSIPAGAVVLLLPSLLCPARPSVSSVRRPRDPAGVVVARPAMGPIGVRRGVQGVGLLPLALLLTVGRGPINQILTRQGMIELRLLLPELDVRLEVLPAIFAPLRRVSARCVLALQVGRHGHPRKRTIIARVPVINPTRLRVEWMMTGLVLWTRLTLTGMTHSGLSWASSGASTPWKSLKEPHQLDARLLLHRSMG